MVETLKLRSLGSNVDRRLSALENGSARRGNLCPRMPGVDPVRMLNVDRSIMLGYVAVWLGWILARH
jgi:hypothetical protein